MYFYSNKMVHQNSFVACQILELKSCCRLSCFLYFADCIRNKQNMLLAGWDWSELLGTTQNKGMIMTMIGCRNCFLSTKLLCAFCGCRQVSVLLFVQMCVFDSFVEWRAGAAVFQALSVHGHWIQHAILVCVCKDTAAEDLQSPSVPLFNQALVLTFQIKASNFASASSTASGIKFDFAVNRLRLRGMKFSPCIFFSQLFGPVFFPVLSFSLSLSPSPLNFCSS